MKKKKEPLESVTAYIPRAWAEKLKVKVKREGYTSISEFLRSIIRNILANSPVPGKGLQGDKPEDSDKKLVLEVPA